MGGNGNISANRETIEKLNDTFSEEKRGIVASRNCMHDEA